MVSLTQPTCIYCGTERESYTGDPCECADAKAKRAEREAMHNAKPTAAVAPPPPARDLADGWLVDLRRQGARDQRDAARETSLHDRKLVLDEEDILDRERRLAEGQQARQDKMDAIYADQGGGAVADWEAFEAGRLLIVVDESRRVMPAILERVDLRPILYARMVNYIAARPNGGKSWVAMEAIVHAVQCGGRVVILDYDMKRPDTLAIRAETMARADLFKDQSSVYFADLDKWENPALRAAATEWLLSAPNPDYSTVIIDTDTSAGAANNGDDIRKWWDKHITPWEDRQIGVLVLAHLPKNGGEQTYGPMGSQDKRGKLTGASYRLETVSAWNAEQGGLVQMVVDKDKHGMLPAVEGEIAADVVAEWMELDGQRFLSITIQPPDEHRGHEQKAGKLTEKLYAALAEYPEGVYSQKEVNKLVKGGGRALGDALKTLLETGRAVAVPVEGKRGHAYKVDLYFD